MEKDAQDQGRSPRRGVGSVSGALAVLLGVLVVQCLPALPPPRLDLALALGGLLLWRWPRLRLPALALFGFAWCAWRAGLALEQRLPRELEGRDFVLIGVVDELPRSQPEATRLLLRVERAWLLDGSTADAEMEVPLRGRVRLSWYDDAPQQGLACSRWRLRARLKRPRGLVNRGGFDSERQALERRITAVGYVREAELARALDGPVFCVDRLREHLSAQIAERVGEPRAAALLQALAVGDTRGLSQQDWAVARANGVPHLLAISGLHVGIAAMAGALLPRLAWWLWPALGLRLALPIAQAPLALLLALGYGLLAGASLPTVRTLLMIAVVALVRCGRRAGSGPQGLALALLAMLAVDPLATLAPGFWLSFAGVAFLMLSLQPPEKGLFGFARSLGAAQLLMSVSLLPLTVWFFGQASLVGSLSNLIAVPLVSLVIVPICLLSLLLLLLWPPLAALPLALAAQLARGLWWLLDRLAGWPGAEWYLPELAPWALALALVGALWLFLPRGVPARTLGALLFLPLLAPPRALPAPGGFEAFVIDVGQGLAVLVRTESSALLFDAGARYPSGFDLGETAVLPTLRALGISRLDHILVSHGDSDHAGGAAAVAAAHPEALLLAGEPARLPLASTQCEAGQEWAFDGVRFRILHPRAELADVLRENDRSCVLLVSGRGGRLLLPGDISRRVEARVAAAIDPGPPLVLLAPHHGSRSSSSAAFLHALAPSIAVVSAGWRSRYGHPHPQTLERYAAAGAPLLNTAQAGALHLAFPPDRAPFIASRERDRLRRYWRE